MAKANIPLADAKRELRRINKVLDRPHLLIGGLAVQQYVPHRISSDIDLVCEFGTALKIIHNLYPSTFWDIEEKNRDEYRPSYVISPIAKEGGLGSIAFGPKILERGAYKHLEWDQIQEGAKPFEFQGELLENILVPRPEALAFTKQISFIGRDKTHIDKRLQDLHDFVELSNRKGFEFKTFMGFMYREVVYRDIRRDFKIEDQEQLDIMCKSILYPLYHDLFTKPLEAAAKEGEKKSEGPTNGSLDSDKEIPTMAAEIAEITNRYEPKNLHNSRSGDLLIVVDVQNDFMPGGAMPTPGAETLVAPLNRFVEKAKEAGMQIVFTRDWHPPDHYSFWKWTAHCIQGTNGAAFPASLEIPDGSHIIDIGTRNDADGYSPFADPKLQALAANPQVKTIYICGIALEFCVLATCRDAARYDKTVIALEPYIRADQKNRNDVEFFWQIVGSFGVIRAQNAPF